MFNPKDYPPNWAELREAVLERAGDRCEKCALPNGRMGARSVEGVFWNADVIEGMTANSKQQVFGTDTPRLFRIVLTVAHVCHHKSCDELHHLLALCQRCHLNLDREENQRKARATRAARKEAQD